jgi:hypothetical protein
MYCAETSTAYDFCDGRLIGRCKAILLKRCLVGLSPERWLSVPSTHRIQALPALTPRVLHKNLEYTADKFIHSW